MRKKRITSKDIAKMAGVSQATVSYVLNDVPNAVSEETRQLVLEIARKYNYYPNAHARSMKTNKSQTIGVVATMRSNRYENYDCIIGIQEILDKNDYNLFLCNIHPGDTGKEERHIRFFLENRVDGIIFISTTARRDYEHIKALQGIPHMIINGHPRDVTSNCIIVDNFGGSKDATKHLIELGREKLVMLSAPLKSGAVEDRERGYKVALEEAGSVSDGYILVRPRGYGIEQGRTLILDLFKTKERFDGIVAVNDNMAIGAMQILKENQIRVPEDVAVIGFNDSKESLVVTPRLSSVAQPFYEAGKVAAEMLLKKLAKECDDSEPITLGCEVRVRESSKVTTTVF